MILLTFYAVGMILKLACMEERHWGLTASMAGVLSEAARVCLTRHHQSPKTIDVRDAGMQMQCEVAWEQPNDRILRAHANEIDATELGACCLSLAAVEELKGLVAVSRAETLSGADYYVAPVSSAVEDLETAMRLEVSGLNNGNLTDCEYRLSKKIAQTQAAPHDTPALAAVVGFKLAAILVSDLIS